jgi:hypothetical protein
MGGGGGRPLIKGETFDTLQLSTWGNEFLIFSAHKLDRQLLIRQVVDQPGFLTDWLLRLTIRVAYQTDRFPHRLLTRQTAYQTGGLPDRLLTRQIAYQTGCLPDRLLTRQVAYQTGCLPD